MKTIVLYTSKTGFTAQYARWIAEALACPCEPLAAVSPKALSGYDRVIFGGWVFGNGIVGLEKLRAAAIPAAVFAVGATPAYEEVISAIQAQNSLGDIPLFYMQGGFRPEKLGLAKRLLLRVLKKAVAKESPRTRQGDFMAESLGTAIDRASRAQIKPLTEYFKEEA